jgi:hypothetical protein
VNSLCRGVHNPADFTNTASKIAQDMNKWFTTNLLSPNADKSQHKQFVTKTSSLMYLHLMCKDKETAKTFNIKFLGLTLDNTFSWKNHIDAIVPKLSSACFAVFIPRISEDGILLLSLCNDLWISILEQFIS